MKKAGIVTTAVFSGLFFIAGCSNNPTLANNNQDYSLVSTYEDNSGNEIARDIARLAETFNYSFKITLGALKTQASTDIQWQNWTYTDNWWTRSGSISLSSADGSIQMAATDSVKFVDASSTPVKNPLLGTVTAGEIRNHGFFDIEISTGGQVTISRDYQLNGNVTDQKTLSLNGTLKQIFSAHDATSTNTCNFEGTATISNVVFTKDLLGWSKPQSGTAQVISTYKNISITFDKGSAAIVVKAKDGSVVTSTTVAL